MPLKENEKGRKKLLVLYKALLYKQKQLNKEANFTEWRRKSCRQPVRHFCLLAGKVMT